MFVFSDEDNPTIIDLYNRKWEQYYKKAMHLTRNPNSAEEIVQQVFLDFIDAYDKKRSMGIDEMEKYLMQMVINQASGRMKNQREVLTDPEEISNLKDQRTLDVFERREYWLILRDACKRLSPRCHQYLLLSSYGFDNAAIADIMGISLQSAYVLHTRTIQQLHKQIDLIERGGKNGGQ